MRFYSIGFSELMRLSVNSFWMLHKNIDRIKAEEDYRQVVLIVNTATGENLSEYVKKLEEQIGEPIIFDKAIIAKNEKLDEEGLAELKRMAKVR